MRCIRRPATIAVLATLVAVGPALAFEPLAPEVAASQAEILIADGDVTAAIPLLARAGRNWYPEADLRLGLLYLEGAGIERDPRRAMSHLERAAKPNRKRVRHKRGLPEAQHALAHLHGSGEAGRADPRAAYRLHKAAARAGHAGSQLALARVYATGEGARSDAAEAYRWATIARNANAPAIRDDAEHLAESLRGGLAFGLRERIEREAARFAGRDG